MTDWISTVLACVALVLSIAVAYDSYRSRRVADRTANVTVYFHRVSEFARVVSAEGTERRAGYHLVLWNQGPAAATDVAVAIRDRGGAEVPLADLHPDEFPLARLGSAARYPVPWLPTEDQHRAGRRFIVTLTWSDGNGRHSQVVPLRRGETSL